MTKKTESDTTILTATIKAALGTVSKALAKSALPILTTIHMQAEGDVLTLTATDLETAISVVAPASVTKTWAGCAPGTTLTSLASAAPGERVDFTWDAESVTLHVASQGTKAKLKSLTADEFPNTAAPDAQLMGTVPANELRSALKRVVVAASVDESRPALNCIQLALINRKVCLTAADGFRLATYHIDDLLTFHAKTSLLIPRNAILKLVAILPDDASQVAVSILDNDRAILMTWGNVKFRAQLADFNFPEWQAIFPAEFKHDLPVNNDDFQSAVRRAEIFAREGQKIVYLGSDPDGLRIYGQASEIGRGDTVIESVPMPINIAFNVTFVRQGLEAVATDPVHMRLNASNAPAMLTNGTDKYRYLIMPMMATDTIEVAKAAEVAKASEEAAASE